ncbi:MAG: hypothetical protein IPL78_29815 [Chloroflexi bacterium]|nr:hypothetical protein [Chloroflexota bacterium]
MHAGVWSPQRRQNQECANSYTVRPQSMTGIAVGMRLDIGGRGKETVIVTAITASTFTAIFENSHPGDAPVTRATLQTVTPSSMTGITVGRSYQIGNEAAATDSQIEDIVVISVTGSTFTAEFKAPHGSTDSVQRIYRPESVTGGYMEITSLRVATTTANAVSTTIGSNITAGTRTVTPASMANIYEGQKLVIDGSGVGDLGEIVTVTAITSTTFTADFALSHTTTITVKGIVVYGSEIVAAITTLAAALNPAQLSDSPAGIEATSRDLEIERYEDVPAVDVLGYLADEGDDDRYEVGVWDAQRVHFRERGSQARTWYTDVVELELDSTLDTLTNQVHGTYRSAGGETLRTATADNSQSQTRYGIIRRGFVTASTTSDKQATAVRDSYLVARNIITPRIGIVTEGLFDGAGIQHPLWMLRTGDVLELRNLPVTLSETVDKVRRFRVKKKTYDVDRDILKPVPELELPGLDIFMTTPMLKAAKQSAKADWSRAINPAADWAR